MDAAMGRELFHLSEPAFRLAKITLNSSHVRLRFCPCVKASPLMAQTHDLVVAKKA
jgi:hypothetical protein